MKTLLHQRRPFGQSTFTKIMFAAVLLSFVSLNNTSAQTIPSTGGSYTINNAAGTFSGTAASGNYQTFTAAVAALNAAYATTTLTGTVTFTVSSGQTFNTTLNPETFPLIINDNGNNPANNPAVTFQTDGVSANPVIQSLSTGSGTISRIGTISSLITAPGMFGDAFVIFNGTDNITFNGIDLTDIYTATSANDVKIMDIGYLLARSSATDGCQGVTIQNCNITLSPSYNTYFSTFNNLTYGIVQESISKTGTAIAPTSLLGLHNGNKFYGNVIKNVAGGILVAGTTQSTSPFTYYDQNCEVGSTTAGTGNTITNFGGTGNVNAANTIVKFGVLEAFQTNFSVVGNTISNGINADVSGSPLWGIVFFSGVNVNIFNNKIYGFNNTSATSTLVLLAGIVSSYKTPAGTGPYYVYNNFIGDFNSVSTATSSPVIAGIYQTNTSGALISPLGIYYNTVWLNNSSGVNTAGIYLLSTATLIKDFRNNIVVNTSTPGTKYTVAFGRAAAGFTDLASTTNNNLYYAGTPGTNNLICGIAFPPTTSYQTLCNYQVAANGGPTCPGTGVESASISYNPTWANISVDASSTFLTLYGAQAAIGGGAGISSPISISSDYFGTTRVTSGATTIGAQEITTSFSTNTITTGTVSGASPYCQGSTVTVPFTISGTFNPDNVFSAQITDASGAILSYPSLGTLAQATAGSITATLPYVPAGTYRIVIQSSDPVVIGSVSPTITFSTAPTITISNGTNNEEACSTATSVNMNYTYTGSPVSYSIVWSNTATTAGLHNVTSATLNAPTAIGITPLLTAPSTSTVIETGALTVTDGNGCVSLPATINYQFDGIGAVNITTTPSVCSGITSTTLNYTTLNSPYNYTITWIANSAGLSITPSSGYPLPTSLPIAIPVGAAPGTYTGQIRTNSSNDCDIYSYNVPFSVTVVGPPAAPSPTGTSPICQGSAPTVFTGSSIGATSYTWSITPAAGSISGTTNTATVTWNSTYTGTATVSETATGSCGTTSSAGTFNVTVNANPTITVIPGTSSICLNDVLPQTASGASTYSWSPSTGLDVNAGASVNASPVSTTTYTVIGTSGSGCTNFTTVVVTVKPLPLLVVTPNNAVCTGTTSAALTASGASTYTWLPISNLMPSAGTSAIETAQISALTIYTVTGTGSNGCTINTTVPVATVAVGGTISAPYSIICSGGTKGLSVINAAGNDYQWQISADNSTWSNISGATNTTYTTANGDGTTNKFYRMLALSNSCWNVASTTAEVDVSIPNIAVTATNITDNSLTLNWSPVGSGNYSISYSGPSSATFTSVTPSKTITGLTANGNYSVTVTQTGVSGCPASGTLTGVNTLCAMPTGVTLSSPAPAQIQVSWTGVGGADYRVYYRPLFSYNTYFTKDVSNVSSVLLTKQGANSLYASTTYEVYVSRLDCPTTGAVGQGTNPTNVTTLPTVTCATPVIDSVRSLCPVQIEVFIHDNGVNLYNVFIQRITPSILAVNSYGVSGTYFTINTPYSGDQFLIAVEAKCGSALSAIYVWPGNVSIKPLCNAPANLILSNPTCHGFTASWNDDQCLSNSASGYDFYLRVAGTINYNSYGASLAVAPVGPNKLVNWLTSGRSYQVFVRSIYNCNGFVTYGPTSLVQTISTLSSGCRDEETEQPQENKPASQQYSPDNSEVFSLYPNPNNGEFVVNLSRLSKEEDAVRIEVINMMGQTVVTDLTTISGGQLNEYINLPNGTATGTYIVRLTAGKNVYTTKVNISR